MVGCAANNVAFCAMHCQLPLTMTYYCTFNLLKDVELSTYCCPLNYNCTFSYLLGLEPK